MSERRRRRRYFARSETPVCDFCIGPDVRWEYRTTVFTLPADDDFVEYVDSGDWAACDACMHDIEGGNFEAIAARLYVNMIANLEPGESIDSGSMRWASRMFMTFQANKIAGPLPER